MSDHPILVALAELGPTADEVASALELRKVRGYRESCSDCPLAVYLVGRFGSENLVDVYPETVDWYPFEADDPRTLPLPAHLTQFVRRFDHGEWPSLDADMENADAR